MLIKNFIEDFDDIGEQNLERLWIKESSKRFQEFKAGKIEARLGADIFLMPGKK